MMVRKAKLGIGMLAIGMATALAPTVTASAAVEKSAICKAYAADVAQSNKGSTALSKAMTSGNWSVAKKAMLKSFNNEENAQRDFQAFLSGAPAKVKAAANVALGLDDKFKSIIQHSSSVQQFAAATVKATELPKVAAALKVLDNYSQSLHCGVN